MSKILSLLDSTQFKILFTFLVIGFSLLLRAIIGRIINNKVSKLNAKYLWRQTSNYIVTIFALLNLTVIWFEGYKSIISLLSLVSAAVILVSKEPIQNFLAYFVIIWRSLFEVGDRIEIGNVHGDVMDFGLMYITLAEVGNWVQGDEPTGRIIKIPNSKIFIETVANYSRGASAIWNEVEITFTFNSNHEKITKLLREIVYEVSLKLTNEDIAELKNNFEELLFPIHEPNVTFELEKGKITYTLRYICSFYKRRESESRLWNIVLSKLSNQSDIEFAK